MIKKVKSIIPGVIMLISCAFATICAAFGNMDFRVVRS